MMTLTKKEGFATTPRRKCDYMFASLDSKRARGDWLFPLAPQKYKIVDTHINMEERKRHEHTMKMIGKLTLFYNTRTRNHVLSKR